MIPRNHVKEKGEDAVEATIASEAPLKTEAKMTDVPDEDEGPTAIQPNTESPNSVTCK